MVTFLKLFLLLENKHGCSALRLVERRGEENEEVEDENLSLVVHMLVKPLKMRTLYGFINV